MDNLFNFDFSVLVQQYFFPFVRVLALIMVAPITGEKEVPNRVKIALAVIITLLLPPADNYRAITVLSPLGIWIIIQQIIVGIVMGYTMQLAFMTLRIAGELIGMQMGLSMATFYDPIGGPATSVLSRLFNIIGLLIFLSLDGHLWLLYCLGQSFDIIPISTTLLNGNGYLTMIDSSALLFINGIMLALPIMTLLLIVNAALGILNRMTPQLSIFVVGYPATLLLGLVILSYLMPTIVPFSQYLFNLFFNKLVVILAELGH